MGLLAPHLTSQNCEQLLSSAWHKSKREIEHIVAAIRPLPAVAPVIRKLPVRRPATSIAAPGTTEQSMLVEPGSAKEARPTPAIPDLPVPPAPNTSTSGWSSGLAVQRAMVTPLASERYKLQVTISRETHDKLRRAQDLLRHCIPDGDPAAVLDRALTLLVADLEKKKLAAARRPRTATAAATHSRNVPAAVRREVWDRDEARCAFVGTEGRCSERGFLELHHVVPFADGGATDAANLELRCRAHNAYEAEQWFGPLVVRERQPPYRSASCSRQSPIEGHSVRSELDLGTRLIPLVD